MMVIGVELKLKKRDLCVVIKSWMGKGMMVIGVELKLKKRDLCVVIRNICVIIIMHVDREQ